MALAGASVVSAAQSELAHAKPSGTSRSGGGWIPPKQFLEGLPQLMRLASLPGLSMAVVERGSVVWTQVHGVVNATTREATRVDSLFEAASISKPVFAYGVLQLVDRKKIELDRPLVSYYRPPYLPNDPYIDQITARHALAHTSGLPNWGEETKPETLKPAFRPGQYFRYSGEGYFWLQLVAEKITGKGLAALMREQLFEPAGMTRSTFAWDEEHLADISFGHRSGRLVANHGSRGVMDLIAARSKAWGKPIRDWAHEDWIRVGTEAMPSAPPIRIRFQNAAGSLLTTASDYARFVALICERSPRAPWEISESLRRAMITPQVAVQDGVPFSWGLGWSLEQRVDGVRFAHEGNNDNLFTSYAIGDPARSRGLVILTNDGSGNGVLQRVTRAATAFDPLSFGVNMDPPRTGAPALRGG
jgi:CubicO group peptidase (beta-lactamase class C family)